MQDAANTVDSDKKSISRACLNVNNQFAGYYWSYEKIEPFVPKKDKRKKKVYQYSLDGKFIACYNSIAEASKITEVNKSSIAKVCRGERKAAGDYKWTT